jgi:catechol 2,3-dioxygenase-like lactoylglutathione lyase family enzyme
MVVGSSGDVGRDLRDRVGDCTPNPVGQSLDTPGAARRVHYRAVSAIRFDHIAIAVPRMAEAPAVLVGELGGTPAGGGVNRTFTFGHWRFAGGGRLEILEPTTADGFLSRFLARHGPGIHHVTFTVPNLREVCDRAERHGYTVVGYDDADPDWKEAFLHPKEAQGIVVQLAEARGHDGRGPSTWQAPPGLANLPPAVTLAGLRLRGRSRERAHTQWEIVLGGRRVEEPDARLVYRWSPSPMRIAVELDPLAAEGPVAIEVATNRTMSFADKRHPLLGTVLARI